MKTSLRTLFPSIRPILMSFHADQIQAETAFCSSGQFSLHGPDKSRHCTITSHKSVSVPHCAEWMNYWTGAGEKDVRTYTQTRPRVRSRIGFAQSRSSALIIWWAWGWCLVLMWTGESVSHMLLDQALNYAVRLPEECKQYLNRRVRVCLVSMGQLAPAGLRCNCITWSHADGMRGIQ